MPARKRVRLIFAVASVLDNRPQYPFYFLLPASCFLLVTASYLLLSILSPSLASARSSLRLASIATPSY